MQSYPTTIQFPDNSFSEADIPTVDNDFDLIEMDVPEIGHSDDEGFCYDC